VLVLATVCSLLFAVADLTRYRLPQAAGLFVLFVALLALVLWRTRKELHTEETE
jgi:uncharacterized membrane protein YqjE